MVDKKPAAMQRSKADLQAPAKQNKVVHGVLVTSILLCLVNSILIFSINKDTSRDIREEDSPADVYVEELNTSIGELETKIAQLNQKILTPQQVKEVFDTDVQSAIKLMLTYIEGLEKKVENVGKLSLELKKKLAELDKKSKALKASKK